MSLVVVTSPENAISNLTDLVTEVRDELDDSAYDITAIYRAIARAEAVFNRELRTPKMETEYQFTTDTEETELPTDFLQMRTAYEENSPDNPLNAMSPAGLRSYYQGRTGSPEAFAVENRRFVMAPIGSATFTILYYARIPSLTTDNPSNWLLEEHPDVYLHQVLAIIFNKIGDRDRAMDNQQIAAGIIEAINKSGKKNRWSGGPLVPRGISQVYGARR